MLFFLDLNCNMISITHAAKKILIQSWKQSGSKYIEFGVKSGGCSGFKYYLKPTNDKLVKKQNQNIRMLSSAFLFS